jgi:hypothetical protein
VWQKCLTVYIFFIVVIVEGDSERGTTTLVYLQLHISLYTGAVHVLRKVAGVHPPV